MAADEARRLVWVLEADDVSTTWGTKLCIDCRFFEPVRAAGPSCRFLLSDDAAPHAKVNPVTGHPWQRLDVLQVRLMLCRGDWWKEREPQP